MRGGPRPGQEGGPSHCHHLGLTTLQCLRVILNTVLREGCIIPWLVFMALAFIIMQASPVALRFAADSIPRLIAVVAVMQELWYKAQKAGEAADEVGDEGYVKLGAQCALHLHVLSPSYMLISASCSKLPREGMVCNCSVDSISVYIGNGIGPGRGNFCQKLALAHQCCHNPKSLPWTLCRR